MAAAVPEGHDVKSRERKSSYQVLPPNMSELRVVLLGNSWSERSKVGNFMFGGTVFDIQKEPDCCLRVRGRCKQKEIVLINTPDLLHPNISEDKLTEFMENCVRLSDPGPHVFLLVLQPEDFTEQLKLRLQSILENINDRSFDHSLILISLPGEENSGLTENFKQHPPLKHLIKMCRYRYLTQKDLELSELLTRLGQIVRENKGEHLSCDESENCTDGLNKTRRPKSLNLVLCGRRGAEKTSAAKAILGHTELHSVSSSSECVKHQGEVCGRWVSLVELPALYGKPQEAVMKESFRCISLCDPEGVHAFILVLPVGPLTDDDKGELKTIQNTFSSRVNDFTMILFTMESDPTAPAVDDFVRKNRDIQELCQSCGGRYVVLNIKNKQQISEMLDTVEKMNAEGSRSFTNDMFTKAQMEKVTRLKAELHTSKTLAYGQMDQIEQQQEAIRKLQAELENLKTKITDAESVNRKIKEQERREKEDKKRREQEEIQRQKWEQKLAALEKKIKSESDEKEIIDKKLMENREEMRKEREDWEKKQKEMWKKQNQEDEQRRQEEQEKLKKLQEEYDQEREKYEMKRKEEDQIRKEQEEKERKELEENYKKEMKDMKTS
ncbi:GTPase IMAP family member 8-like [Scomber scombrus]|uniref:GTPase IMAP family member 8-like n=1 Tax=Scomber scombrus TaxID=13677 RepID=A0AAV1QG89_SCOSC